MHFLAWINHSCIVIRKLLVLDGSLHYEQCVQYAAIMQIFYCLPWFDIVEFNCLPCPNNEMYDDAGFADRCRYQLIMFEIRVLIGYLDFLVLKIAYEMDTAKIIAAFCLISYCLYDLIRWIQSSAMFKKQDVRWCVFWWSIPISIDYIWSVNIDRAILTLSYSYCIWNSYIENHHW